LRVALKPLDGVGFVVGTAHRVEFDHLLERRDEVVPDDRAVLDDEGLQTVGHRTRLGGGRGAAAADCRVQTVATGRACAMTLILIPWRNRVCRAALATDQLWLTEAPVGHL